MLKPDWRLRELRGRRRREDRERKECEETKADSRAVLVSLERPLRPRGIPGGDTPVHRAAARKIISTLVKKRDLPQFYTQPGAFLNYHHVMRTLIDLSFSSYNEFYADEKIAPPPIVESTPISALRGWGLLRRVGIVEIHCVSPAFASLSALRKPFQLGV